MRFDDDGVAVAADGTAKSQAPDAPSVYAGDTTAKLLSFGGSTAGADKAGDMAEWLGLSDGDLSEGEQTFAIKEVCDLSRGFLLLLPLICFWIYPGGGSLGLGFPPLCFLFLFS